MSTTIESLGFDRALIVQRQWCELILSNTKAWEMRSTKTHFRGRFGLIIAGTGEIHGAADLVDSLDALAPDEYYQYSSKHRIYLQDGVNHKWRYPWVIGKVEHFKTPIKYKHPKGAVIWVNLNNTMLL